MISQTDRHVQRQACRQHCATLLSDTKVTTTEPASYGSPVFGSVTWRGAREDSFSTPDYLRDATRPFFIPQFRTDRDLIVRNDQGRRTPQFVGFARRSHQ